MVFLVAVPVMQTRFPTTSFAVICSLLSCFGCLAVTAHHSIIGLVRKVSNEVLLIIQSLLCLLAQSHSCLGLFVSQHLHGTPSGRWRSVVDSAVHTPGRRCGSLATAAPAGGLVAGATSRRRSGQQRQSDGHGRSAHPGVI